MGRRGYPPEFRRRVLDLIEAGRKVTDIARVLVSALRRSIAGGTRIESTRDSSPVYRAGNAPSFCRPATDRPAREGTQDRASSHGAAKGCEAPKSAIRGHQAHGRGEASDPERLPDP